MTPPRPAPAASPVPLARRVPSRRGAVVLMVVVLLAMVNIAVLAGLDGGAQDSMSAAYRIETARAFYAADAGAFVVLHALSAGTAVPAAGTVITLPTASTTVVSAPASGPGDVVIQGASGLSTRRVQITIDN